MIQCDGCYYQDKKDNVCCHEKPFCGIDGNCTDYVENEFVKKIRAGAIDEIIKHFEEHHIVVFDKFEIVDELEQLKEENNDT